MVERGCWWRDSNPQGLSPRDVKGLCVYQFRHTSTSWLRTLAIPKDKTRDPARAAARARSISSWFQVEGSNCCKTDCFPSAEAAARPLREPLRAHAFAEPALQRTDKIETGEPHFCHTAHPSLRSSLASTHSIRCASA